MSSLMSTSKSTMEENNHTPAESFQVQRSDILPAKSTRYMVMDFLGEGSFGKVAKCVNMTTNEMVAVKILKDREDYSWELEMLEEISSLDPEKTNIVRFIDSFTYNSFSCLAFEMLGRSLWDLFKETRAPLNLNEIRPVMQQLFVAFDALKDIGIVHGDLKPDNIMLVNHRDQPFKVKLIDFGLALPVLGFYTGMTVQAKPYRAPELTLGLPLSEAVDMWSVGCVMSFLYFGYSIFGGDCDYRRMKAMIHMLGQPEDLLLNAGENTSSFFSREDDSSSPGWRLKSPEEYTQATGNKPAVEWKFFQEKGNLEYEVKNFPEKSSTLEYEDRMAFLSLLKAILQMDPGKRITPREALAHPFITMAHLTETGSYRNAALQLMSGILSHSLDKSDNPLSDTESYSDTNADGDTSSNQDEVPSTNCIFNGHSSIPSSSDKDTMMLASSVSSGDHPPTHPSDEGWDSEPVGDSAIATEEDSGAAIPCNDSSTNTDDDNTEEDSDAAIPCNDSSTNTDDKNTEEDSDAAIPCNDSSTNTDDDNTEEDADAAIPCNDSSTNTDDDNTEEDSDAAIPCNDSSTNTDDENTKGAAAAPGPADDANIKKKKKKNLFQRTCKLFRRVKMRLVSVFKRQNN